MVIKKKINLDKGKSPCRGCSSCLFIPFLPMKGSCQRESEPNYAIPRTLLSLLDLPIYYYLVGDLNRGQGRLSILDVLCMY